MDLENFPVNETAKQMMQTITANGFYDRSYIGKWIFQVMGQEIEAAKKYIEELPEQAFRKSATWGIVYQEQKYGIPENTGMTLEERRRQIMIQKILSPVNPAFLERQIGLIVGHDRVEVIENNPEYTFRVEILETDVTAASYPDVRKFVKKAKPSHLAFLLVGRYWSEFPVDISYANCLHMLSEFYPRNNLQWLLLDGTWDLSGEYLLGGYRTGSMADFYPVRIQYLSSYGVYGDIGDGRVLIAGEVQESLRAQGKFLEVLSEAEAEEIYNSAIGHQSLCKVGKSVGSTLKIAGSVEDVIRIGEAPSVLLSETEIKKEYSERLSTIAYCGAEIASESRLRVEVDLWYLDGEEYLDGSHSLKAEVIEYSDEKM